MSVYSLPPAPPTDEHQLFQRAEALSGFTLGELASRAGWNIPA
ncbi:DNA mismatch repair protein MutH, partial [Yersinia enterocolitica]|nr:DNA mismatch repair protein MutH [Yersinia enterocolitica]